MLTNRPIPLLSEKQINQFTQKNIHAVSIGEFDVKKTISKLESSTKHVLALDIGGDKILAGEASMNQGKLEYHGEHQRHQQERNHGYLEFLEQLAATNTLPVGISVAGPVNGTISLGSPNTTAFFEEFKPKYNADFAQLFQNARVEVCNDGAAGLKAGILEAARQNPNLKNVLYLIVGSGLGGALLTHGKLFSAEPGHVPVVNELNPYQVTKPCGVFGNTFACIEEVVGGKAGIEAIWAQMTHKPMNGRKIRERLVAGDKTAAEIYDLSALGAVHTAIGILQAFDVLSEVESTVIVAEGGVFQGDEYADRVIQLLRHFLGEKLSIIFTKDFTQNACLDGAAISALTR
jgi:predicted NBD/HSP70 family sugar kinase